MTPSRSCKPPFQNSTKVPPNSQREHRPYVAAERLRMFGRRMASVDHSQRLPIPRMRYDVAPPNLRAQRARQVGSSLHPPKSHVHEARENITFELGRIRPSVKPLPLSVRGAKGSHPSRHRRRGSRIVLTHVFELASHTRRSSRPTTGPRPEPVGASAQP